MTSRYLTAALAAALLPCTASAQEEIELNFGAALRSDYISDGESRSDGKPVLQGYAEAQRGLFYGGLGASTLDDGTNHLEVDLTFGIRPSFDDLELDISYARTFYDDEGDCCGEIIVFAEYPFSETITAGGGVSVDPESGATWFEVVNGVALGETWSVSGALGTDFGTEDDEDENVVSWDLGLVHDFNDNLWGDVRYYDSTIGAGRLVLAVGIDF